MRMMKRSLSGRAASSACNCSTVSSLFSRTVCASNGSRRRLAAAKIQLARFADGRHGVMHVREIDPSEAAALRLENGAERDQMEVCNAEILTLWDLLPIT